MGRINSRLTAIRRLGIGLSSAGREEEALSVKETELSLYRRLGLPEEHVLVAQGNLANTYQFLGRLEEALEMKQAVYLGHLRLNGEEHEGTLLEASNYADTLMHLNHFDEAKLLLRKMMPVARRVFGDGNEITLRMRWCYAGALYGDPGATLGDLREAVTTLEDVERISRRVMSGAHPITEGIEDDLRNSRAALRARETPGDA